jgi:hypothetical protein
MKLTTLILPLTTLLTQTTADAIGPSGPYAPWEITKLYTFSPSGRPGSSPYSTINLTISDPNTIYAGSAPMTAILFPPNSANCSTQFTTESQPWDKVINCTEQSWARGFWSFEMLKPTNGTFYEYASATEHFDVRFVHTDWIDTKYNLRQVFVGRASFEVGVNMRGQCGGSGVCSWGLKTEATPVLVNQTRTECRGVCS